MLKFIFIFVKAGFGEVLKGREGPKIKSLWRNRG